MDVLLYHYLIQYTRIPVPAIFDKTLLFKDRQWVSDSSRASKCNHANMIVMDVDSRSYSFTQFICKLLCKQWHWNGYIFNVFIDSNCSKCSMTIRFSETFLLHKTPQRSTGPHRFLLSFVVLFCRRLYHFHNSNQNTLT